QLLALDLGAVADADHVEALGEARRDAGDHVRDERPHQAVHRLGALLVAVAIDPDLGPGHLDLAVRRNRLFQRAFGALHAHAAVCDLDLDALRDRHGLFSDAGHDSPDLREQLTTDAGLARLRIGEYTARCREDGDAQTAADLRDLLRAHVHAPA